MALSQRRFWLTLPVTAAGLYLVYHFPVMLAFSALDALWHPLAFLVPPAVLYVVYRRPALRLRYKLLYPVAAGLYRLWLLLFVGGVLVFQYLVDSWMLLVTVPAALVTYRSRDWPRRVWSGAIALGVALLWVAWREPWLVENSARLLFGLGFIGCVAALYPTGEIQRVRAVDLLVLVLLAPSVFSLTAFYRGPDHDRRTDAAVRFLFAAGDPSAPSRVRDAQDLRYAVRDCDGTLLLGGASAPGLERVGARLETVEAAPMGDNLIVHCEGAASSLYGTRRGEIVRRFRAGAERRASTREPILMVQAAWSENLLFTMSRTTSVTARRLDDLQPRAERRSGVNLDILYAPSTRTLYRSVLLRGVEALEPATLKWRGVHEMRWRVGGTLALDERHGRLFVADWLGRAIHVLDARDLTLVARLTAPRGLRHLVYDDRREWLLAGSYFDGEVWVYRPYRGGDPVRIPVGRRVRQLSVAGDRCLGVSARGVFEIDLTRLPQ